MSFLYSGLNEFRTIFWADEDEMWRGYASDPCDVAVFCGGDWWVPHRHQYDRLPVLELFDPRAFPGLPEKARRAAIQAYAEGVGSALSPETLTAIGARDNDHAVQGIADGTFVVAQAKDGSRTISRARPDPVTSALQYITFIPMEQRSQAESMLRDMGGVQDIPLGDVFVFDNGLSPDEAGFACAVLDLATLVDTPDPRISSAEREGAIAAYTGYLTEGLTWEVLEAFGLPDKAAAAEAIAKGTLVTEPDAQGYRTIRRATPEEMFARVARQTDDPLQILGLLSALDPAMAERVRKAMDMARAAGKGDPFWGAFCADAQEVIDGGYLDGAAPNPGDKFN